MRRKLMRGLTLVEMMVTSTLGVFLIASVMLTLSLGHMVWQDTEAKIATVQEARKAMSEIALDLPRSSWSSPQGITIANDGSWIRFQIPQSTGTTGVVWGDVIRYRVGGRGDQLIRENLITGETRVVANFINRVSFGTMADHPTAVTVSFQVQKSSLSTRPFATQLQTNFSVRN